jgi:hypothetical protein
LLWAAVILGSDIPVRAGISVSSYDTSAQTNAYAPLDKSSYFTSLEKPNTTPATVDVEEDWSGTNAGGIAETWRWIGAAHANSMTNISANALTISGAGSFSYDLSTNSDFTDPTQVSTLFSPLASSGYLCHFSTNVPTAYSLSVQLQGHSGVQLFSLKDGTFVVNETHFGGLPTMVAASGVLPAGDFVVSPAANLAAPILPSGMNHVTGSGSYNDLLFSLNIPEPRTDWFTLGVAILLRGRIPRRRVSP